MDVEMVIRRSCRPAHKLGGDQVGDPPRCSVNLQVNLRVADAG